MMRYEIRPHAGVNLKDVIPRINITDLQIVGGKSGLVVQAPQAKVEEIRRAVNGLAELISA